MIGEVRSLECPACGRVVRITEDSTYAKHAALTGSSKRCGKSGADASEQIENAELDDRDDWSSWLSK